MVQGDNNTLESTIAGDGVDNCHERVRFFIFYSGSSTLLSRRSEDEDFSV